MSDKLEALKAKKPLNTKTREAEAAGYVTDDNSGGYYVVECQECGEVYPSQQCNGGGQIADTGDYDDSYCPHCGYVDPDECDNVGLVWNVQQAKINALLAALEEKDKRIAELAVTQMTGPLSLVLKRAAELERIIEGVDQLAIDGGWTARGLSEYAKSLETRNAELEQRLQQPIKLPDLRKEVSGERYVWSDGLYNYRTDLVQMLKEQGHKVEE